MTKTEANTLGENIIVFIAVSLSAIAVFYSLFVTFGYLGPVMILLLQAIKFLISSKQEKGV